MPHNFFLKKYISYLILLLVTNINVYPNFWGKGFNPQKPLPWIRHWIELNITGVKFGVFKS